MLHSLLFSLASSLVLISAEVLTIPSESVPAANDASTTETMQVVEVETPTAEGLQALLAEVVANKDLGEQTRKDLASRYEAALKQLDLAEQSRRKAAAFQKAIADAPAQTETLRQQVRLVEAQGIPELQLPSDLSTNSSLAELRQALAQSKASSSAAKSSLAKVEQSLAERQKRPSAVPAEKDAERERLKKAEAELVQPALEGEPQAGFRSRRLLASAQRLAAQETLAMLEQESLIQPVLLELLTIQRQVAAQNVAILDVEVATLEKAVNTKSATEAKVAEMNAAKAQLEAQNKHRLLQELAATNAVYASRLAEITALNTNINLRLRIAEGRHQSITFAYTNAFRQIEAAGLSKALAAILLNERRQLPDVRELQDERVESRDMISTNALQRVLLDASIQRLLVVNRAARLLVTDTNKVDASLPAAEVQALQQNAEELLQARRELLGTLRTQYDEMLTALNRLDQVQSDYLDLVHAYRRFLSEVLMWTPSAPPVGFNMLPQLAKSAVWLVHPRQWSLIGEAGKGVFQQSFRSGFIVVLLTLLALVARKGMRLQVERIAEKVRRIEEDSFMLTLQATLILLVRVFPFVALPIWFGEALIRVGGASDFIQSIGMAFFYLGINLLVFLPLIELCSSRGIAEIHFRWDKRTIAVLGRQLMRFLPVFAGANFVVASTVWQEDRDVIDSLGRVAFFVVMLALALMAKRLFHPQDGVFSEVLRRNPDGWAARLNRLWYTVVVLGPLVLLGLAAAGYFYTALRLELRLIYTMGYLTAAVLIYHLAIRWLYVRERCIALAQLKERRVARKDTDGDESMLKALAEEPEIKLSTLKTQTRRLLRTLLGFALAVGLWLIWSAEFPALNYLNHYTLWTVNAVADGVTQLKPITLANVVSSLLVVIATIAACRNLPGLLEIAILQNLPLNSGSRYAISAMSQYVLAAVGTVIAFNRLGMNWSQLSWIAAALSVGLGFGLQEVVANFVCGLLLFLERPIRVGDIVTVSDITGLVSRIQIRATTITDWDHKEFIVPNKEFITGRVLNWTLSNSVNRVVIEVGVAYGSDVEKARDLLLEAARENPKVISEPPPMAYFEGFGDSTLNMTLRCFLENFEQRLSTRHALLSAINQKFNEAGIEIAFPQRDLHIRSLPQGMPWATAAQPADTNKKDNPEAAS
ncbi:MAG: mechanosensitive ion channel domain-containing protein [Limisphaerales bacterium]